MEGKAWEGTEKVKYTGGTMKGGKKNERKTGKKEKERRRNGGWKEDGMTEKTKIENIKRTERKKGKNTRKLNFG